MDILIAEDDRVLNRVLQQHFEKRGIKTRGAFDAMQAWSMIMASEPSLVILDVQMPGGTGHEVLKRLKQVPKTSHIPVVVVTGLDDPNLSFVVKEHGADAFFTKPLDMDKLDREVSRLLGIPGPA
jgi:DNA-binding response OmpR family regulator